VPACEHQPRGTCWFRVDVDTYSHSKSHLVTTAVDDSFTHVWPSVSQTQHARLKLIDGTGLYHITYFQTNTATMPAGFEALILDVNSQWMRYCALWCNATPSIPYTLTLKKKPETHDNMQCHISPPHCNHNAIHPVRRNLKSQYPKWTNICQYYPLSFLKSGFVLVK